MWFYIRKNITCNTPNVIYLSTCKNCQLQGVGSTTKWKPRFANYKSHAEHLVDSCSISKHFNTICISRPDSSAFLSFQIIDCLDNIDDLTPADIDDLLLRKETIGYQRSWPCTGEWIARMIGVEKTAGMLMIQCNHFSFKIYFLLLFEILSPLIVTLH